MVFLERETRVEMRQKQFQKKQLLNINLFWHSRFQQINRELRDATTEYLKARHSVWTFLNRAPTIPVEYTALVCYSGAQGGPSTTFSEERKH